ncbi:hypothetical protein Lser_V15G20471 [Lactuca serriola]
MRNKVYLKNIDQIDEKSHMKVRVLKIWNFVRNNKVCSIEMILMDDEGTQYHARVFNQNFSRFHHLLKEDESYIVIKLNMAVVTNGFSYTVHKQTLTLDWKSILKKCDDFSGPVNGFMFVDFNSIIEQTCPRDTFFDEMKLLLVASIVNIRQNLSWYYEACNICGKNITPVPKANHSYTDPEKISETIVVGCTNAQYIIPINVQDCTGTIGLTLFDREAKRLLNISAYELKKIHEAAGDSGGLFPMQLNVLKNRKFGFLVDITEYNVNNYNNIYTVLRVTEDMSIVSELESKIELMSIQSVSLNQVALESDDVVQPVQK